MTKGFREENGYSFFNYTSLCVNSSVIFSGHNYRNYASGYAKLNFKLKWDKDVCPLIPTVLNLQ